MYNALMGVCNIYILGWYAKYAGQGMYSTHSLPFPKEGWVLEKYYSLNRWKFLTTRPKVAIADVCPG